MSLPREFLLVAACSIWPPSERRNETILRAAHEPIDWERFFRIASRHRVIGLVHHGLIAVKLRVPAHVSQAIATAAASQLRKNLAFAAELVRLQKQFAGENMPVTFFKGVPTAIQIYGDLAIRHSKDLDLLVTREAMLRAGAILERAGYSRTDPPPQISSARVNTLLSMGKDFIYGRKDDTTLQVELHWRLFNNVAFLENLPSRAKLLDFPTLDNVCIRTFSGDDQFAYLCAHGAAFAWCRLKWLCDVGAILAREPPGGAERLFAAASARGAGRPAAQAILLCQRLLHLEVSTAFIALLRRDAKVCRLEQLALTAMTQGGAEAEPYDLPSGMRPIAISLWLLGGTPGYLWGELNSRWISWDDVVEVPLPATLQFLYPILRVPLWLLRRLRKRKMSGQRVPP